MGKTQFGVVVTLLLAVAVLQVTSALRSPVVSGDHSSAAIAALGKQLESLERSVRERTATTITLSDDHKDAERLNVALRDIVASELERSLAELQSTLASNGGDARQKLPENTKGDPALYSQAATTLDQAIASRRWTLETYNELIGLTPTLSVQQRDALAQKFSEAIHTGKLDLDEISKSGVPIAF